MLVLTRRSGEIIRIGPNIVVTILGVKGSQVRLGVEAPKDVTIHREEVFERIQRAQETASHSSLPQDVATQARELPEAAEHEPKPRL